MLDPGIGRGITTLARNLESSLSVLFCQLLNCRQIDDWFVNHMLEARLIVGGTAPDSGGLGTLFLIWGPAADAIDVSSQSRNSRRATIP